MLAQCLADQAIEPSDLVVPLDLLIPLPLRILSQPGLNPDDLIDREPFDGGGDFLNRTHRVGLLALSGFLSSSLPNFIPYRILVGLQPGADSSEDRHVGGVRDHLATPRAVPALVVVDGEQALMVVVGHESHRPLIPLGISRRCGQAERFVRGARPEIPARFARAQPEHEVQHRALLPAVILDQLAVEGEDGLPAVIEHVDAPKFNRIEIERETVKKRPDPEKVGRSGPDPDSMG